MHFRGDKHVTMCWIETHCDKIRKTTPGGKSFSRYKTSQLFPPCSNVVWVKLQNFKAKASSFTTLSSCVFNTESPSSSVTRAKLIKLIIHLSFSFLTEACEWAEEVFSCIQNHGRWRMKESFYGHGEKLFSARWCEASKQLKCSCWRRNNIWDREKVSIGLELTMEEKKNRWKQSRENSFPSIFLFGFVFCSVLSTTTQMLIIESHKKKFNCLSFGLFAFILFLIVIFVDSIKCSLKSENPPSLTLLSPTRPSWMGKTRWERTNENKWKI